MSALTSPVLINANRAYWLSSIGNDVIHSTITTQEIDAGIARFSTCYVSDFLTTSTLNASSFKTSFMDLSEANISTLKTNQAFTSTLTWASDLSGGLGYVRITTDASGVQVDGDPIRFDNLVYFTSTITIVPVSTIVDTDIFSQNGYFSTLSSGSISTGRLQATAASISSLTVSSIVATDISGYKPSDWSLYPTLNSSIQFQPAYVLSNVNNKLFFAGYELTDASGGGADWSAFPAYQDVSMNNFSMRGLSTLQYQDGARLYSQTGNNLFYNGQPISYGQLGAASNWAKYPANSNVVLTGFGIATTSNLPIAASSNIQFFAQGVSTVVDQGLNIASTANYDITVQNGNRGIINLTANGGNNNGLFGTINLTANGTSLAGVGSGGLININANTPSGFSNATSAIKMNAAGINSYAGLIPPIGSLAGYNFIYGTNGVNIASGLPAAFPNIPFTTYLYGTAGVTTSSDFYVPNIYPYFNGLTTPPDLLISGRYIVPNLAQVYVQLSNVKNIYMDGAAQIQNANLVSTVSTIGSVANFGTGQFGTLSASSAGIGAANITTINSVNIYNGASTITSSLKSYNVSTTDVWLSSINGLPWDISGGSAPVSNKFSTLVASSFTVSSISGVGGFPIKMTSFVQFPYPGAGTIDNVQQINLNSDLIPALTLQASTINIAANNVNIGRSLSTLRVNVSSLKTSTIQGQGGYVDISGGLNVTNNIQIPYGVGINWDDGSFVTYSRLERRDVANNNMLALTNTPTSTPPMTSNMLPLGVGEIWITGQTDQYSATRMYSEFPYDNFGIDMIDANGTTLFETLNCYDTGGVNFQTNVYGVSSIVGWTPNFPGAQQAVGVQGILTANQVSTTSLKYTSTLEWYNSNTQFNIPIRIEQDTAGNLSNAGVAISIKGHDFGTGAAQHELIMGYRSSDAANFITAVWQGQNLEDLSIEGDPVKITDGALSTIFNQNPYAVQTTGGVAVGVGSGIITLSTNHLKVGGQTNLTMDSISTTILQTQYGNNLYYAGQQQPCIFHGKVNLPAGGGSVSSLITLPTAYTTKDFDVNLTYINQFDNTGLYWSTQTANSFLAFGGGGKSMSWASYGNLPFTG